MSHKDYLRLMEIEVWKLRESESLPASQEAETSAQDLLTEDHTQTLPQGDISQMGLPALSALVGYCEQCILCQSRTNTVFGSGSNNADLMFIGEAPGCGRRQTGIAICW